MLYMLCTRIKLLSIVIVTPPLRTCSDGFRCFGAGWAEHSQWCQLILGTATVAKRQFSSSFICLT